MPNLSGNVNKLCFGIHQSNCRDEIGPMTPDCDLDFEFRHIKIICDKPSNYGPLFVKFDKICSCRFG